MQAGRVVLQKNGNPFEGVADNHLNQKYYEKDTYFYGSALCDGCCCPAMSAWVLANQPFK